MTSVAIGNCGFRLCPCARRSARTSDADHDSSGIYSLCFDEGWPAVGPGSPFRNFLDSLERQPLGVNILPCVLPLGPLITWVIGNPEEAKAAGTHWRKEELEIARLFNEATGRRRIGAESAQRLRTRVVQSALQRDYDGTPMRSLT